jgi:hypothetical protein
MGKAVWRRTLVERYIYRTVSTITGSERYLVRYRKGDKETTHDTLDDARAALATYLAAPPLPKPSQRKTYKRRAKFAETFMQFGGMVAMPPPEPEPETGPCVEDRPKPKPRFPTGHGLQHFFSPRTIQRMRQMEVTHGPNTVYPDKPVLGGNDNVCNGDVDIGHTTGPDTWRVGAKRNIRRSMT